MLTVKPISCYDHQFLHETHAITCRFWLRGTCLQGEHCVFSHDFTEYYKLNDDELARRDYDSEDELDDGASMLNFEAEDMFPSLGGSAPAPPAPSSSPYATNNDSIAGVSSLSMNFARAVSLQPAAPGMSLDYSNPFSSSSQQQRRTPVPAPPPRPLYHKDVYNGSRWVSTGAAVASQYMELREEAYQLACARNKCFMGATQAYRRC